MTTAGLEYMVKIGVITPGQLPVLISQLQQLETITNQLAISNANLSRLERETKILKESSIALQKQDLALLAERKAAMQQFAVIDKQTSAQKNAVNKELTAIEKQYIAIRQQRYKNDITIEQYQARTNATIKAHGVAMSKLTDIEKQHSTAMVNQNLKVAEINRSIVQNISTMQAQKSQIQQNTIAINNEKIAQDRLNASMKVINRQVGPNSQVVKQTTATAQRAGLVIGPDDTKNMGVLSNKIADVDKGTIVARQHTDAYNETIRKLGKSGTDTFETMLRTVRRIITTMITLSGIYFLKSLIEQGAEFENIMNRIGAILKLTGSQLKAFSLDIRNMVTSSIYSFKEVTEATETLAQMGYSTSQIMMMLNPILKMSTAALADLKVTTELVATSMIAFNIKAEETARIVNLLTEASILSRADIPMLADAFKYAGSAGAAFNQSIETTTASVAKFIDMGLSASLAGTAFRQGLIQLSMASKKQIEIFKELNLTLADIDPSLNDFGKILQTFAKSSLTAAQAIEVFGTRAGGSIYGLIQRVRQGGQDIVEFTNKLTDAEKLNRVEQIYTQITDSLVSKFKFTKNAMADMGVELFNVFKPALAELIGKLTNSFKSFNDELKSKSGKDFSETMVALVPIIATIGTGFAHAIGAFGNLFIIILKLIEFVPALNKILEGFIMLLTALIVKHIILTNIMGGFAKTIVSVSNHLLDMVGIEAVTITTTKGMSLVIGLGGKTFEIFKGSVISATWALRAFKLAVTTLLTVGIGLLITGLIEGVTWLYNYLAGTDDATKSTEDLSGALAQEEEKFKAINDALGIHITKQEQLNALTNSGIVNFSKFGDTVVGVAAKTPDFVEIMNLKNAPKAVKVTMDDIVGQTNNLINAFTNVANSVDKGLNTDLEKTQIEMTAISEQMWDFLDTVPNMITDMPGIVVKFDAETMKKETLEAARQLNDDFLYNLDQFNASTNFFTKVKGFDASSVTGLKSIPADLMSGMKPIIDRLGIEMNDTNAKYAVLATQQWIKALEKVAVYEHDINAGVSTDVNASFGSSFENLAKIGEGVERLKTSFSILMGDDSKNRDLLIAKQDTINEQAKYLGILMKDVKIERDKINETLDASLHGGKKLGDIEMLLLLQKKANLDIILKSGTGLLGSVAILGRTLDNIKLIKSKNAEINAEITLENKLRQDLIISTLRENEIRKESFNNEVKLFERINELSRSGIDVQKEFGREKDKLKYNQIVVDLKTALSTIETMNIQERNLLTLKQARAKLEKQATENLVFKTDTQGKQLLTDERNMANEKTKGEIATATLAIYQKSTSISQLNKKINDLIVTSQEKITSLMQEQASIQEFIRNEKNDFIGDADMKKMNDMTNAYQEQISKGQMIRGVWSQIENIGQDFNTAAAGIVSKENESRIQILAKLEATKSLTPIQKEELSLRRSIVENLYEGADIEKLGRDGKELSIRQENMILNLYDYQIEKQRILMMNNAKKRNLEIYSLAGASDYVSKLSQQIDLTTKLADQKVRIASMEEKGPQGNQTMDQWKQQLDLEKQTKNELDIMANGGYIDKLVLELDKFIFGWGNALDAVEATKNVIIGLGGIMLDNLTKLATDRALIALGLATDPEVEKEKENLKKMKDNYDEYLKKVAEINAKYNDERTEEEIKHMQNMYDIGIKYADLIRSKEDEIYNERVNKMMELSALEEQLRNKGLTSEEQRASLMMEINNSLASVQVGSIEERQMKLAGLEEQIKALNELENNLGISRQEIESSSLARLSDLQNATSQFYTDKQNLAIADLQTQKQTEEQAELQRTQARLAEIERNRQLDLAQAAIDLANKQAEVQTTKDALTAEQQLRADMTTFMIEQLMTYGAKLAVQFATEKGLSLAVSLFKRSLTSQELTQEQQVSRQRQVMAVQTATTEVASNSASASAKGASSAAALPFPFNLIAIVSTVAMIAGVFAGIWALINKKASGGEILKRANGGIITGGHGGIDDIYTTLPEHSYVVNRQSTAIHNAELSRMANGGVPVALTSGEYLMTPPHSIMYRNRLAEINRDRSGETKHLFGGGHVGYANGGSVRGSGASITVVNEFSGVNMITGDSEAAVSELFDTTIKKKIQDAIDSNQIVIS